MAPTGSKHRPRFFWQGMLILLPVLVMAGIALAALVQDRAAAEREARRRAEEALQQLGNGFERDMGLRLSQFALGTGEWYGQLWTQHYLTEAALWPGSEWRQPIEAHRKSLARYFEAMEGAYAELERGTGLRPEAFMLSGLAFNADGQVTQPPEALRAPQPPPWRLALSPEQSAALTALEDLSPATTDDSRMNAAFRRFRDTRPSDAARTEAEFIRLQLLLAKAPATNAVSQWLEFAQRCGGQLESTQLLVLRETRAQALSESGLPLSTLALAKALQRAGETGPNEVLWRALVHEVGWAPSALTPMLLELAEPLTRRRPELQSCLQALRWNWAATERTWEAADAIRRSGRLQGTTTTNLWLDFEGLRWLCLLQPAGESWQGRGEDVTTNYFTQARLCPKALVEQALRHVAQESGFALPPYLRLTVELEGEPLPLGPSTNSGLTLAQTAGQLTCPTVRNAAVRNGNLEWPHPAEFESLPGRPHYTLRIELADRALMLAAQKRRMVLFGSLVLAAALTAAVGFAAAYRSFQRQLRLSEMKSNFVSSVSHELRAPIASVRLMAESLERGKIAEAARQREYFRFIGQECRRLSSLIENVLDFSRIEQNRKQYEFEPTDVVELTRQTVKLMETYAEEKGVGLRLQLPEAVSSLKSQVSSLGLQPVLDGKAIQQALVNLIDNALKHSPKGEQVTVGLEIHSPESAGEHASRITHHASFLTLWVEDHGPGIPLAEQEKIFERFYRLGSELRRETQGVGIGLSIVKHVVEAHSGRVQVRSEVGKGSRFTIELPMTPEEAKSEGRRPKSE